MSSFSRISFFILFLIFGSTAIKGQTHEYKEEMNNPYLAPIKETKKRSKGYTFSNGSITTVQVNVDEQGNNIPNDAANEPSLAIDELDINRMAIGWRQFDNIQSDFRQAGIGVSDNFGSSWNVLEPIEKGLFRSDPVLTTDGEGNFYYNSLTQNFICDVFKSENLENWDDKTFAFGGDKQWMVIDKTDKSSRGNMYANWNRDFTDCRGNFTRSTNKGQNFESCSYALQNPKYGSLEIDVNGDLYAAGAYAGSFVVIKSESAKDPLTAVTWEQEALVDLKGETSIFTGPNPRGLNGQTWIASDKSNTSSRGNVYLLSSAQRRVVSDPCDVMFAKSVDGGKTWSEAVKINDDNVNGNWQWMGTMSVAPNGRIDVIWLDTRDSPGTYLSSLYYSYSEDAGETWSTNEELSDYFDPHIGWPQQNKMGDYYDMISLDEGAHLAWAATFNGEQDVYYSFIPAPISTSNQDVERAKMRGLIVSPNPIVDDFTLELYAETNQSVTVEILDMTGKIIGGLQNRKITKGLNRISMNRSTLYLPPSGIYFIRVANEIGQSLVSKVVFK